MSADDIHGTQPVRFLDQRTMERILAVADDAGLSREAIRVPLAGAGSGHIERGAHGIWTVVVPASGALDGFLERLRQALTADRAD